jgi:hypothetical protein
MAGDDLVPRLRLRAQRLEPRSTEGAAAVVAATFGIQAQDVRAAGLALRARSRNLAAADGTQPGIVRTWAWRGTLHLIAEQDVAAVLTLVAPAAIRGTAARWRQLGLDEATYARARVAIGEALADGPLNRPALRDRLSARGIDATGQRLPHLLRRAAFDGVLSAPADGSYSTLVLPPAPPREQALELVARRYLAAYGPAGPLDLAAWSGLSAADVRAAWAAIASEVVEAAPDLWILPGAVDPAAHGSVRLLPSFDALLLGYRDRSHLIEPEHTALIWPGGGWLHPALLVDGRIAGTWRLDRTTGAAVVVTPFTPLAPGDVAALGAEVEDVGRFLGVPAHLELAH